MGPIARADGHDRQRLIDERVPCVVLAQAAKVTQSGGVLPGPRENLGLVHDDKLDVIDSSRHGASLGSLLIAALSTGRGKRRRHLAALHAGLRRSKYPHSRQHDAASRLSGFARTIEAMAKNSTD
jgi:hypothetical protein